MFDAIVDQFLVDFVRNDIDPVLHGNGHEGFDLGPVVNHTDGVGRAVKDDRLGLGGNRRLKGLRRHFVIVGLAAGDEYGRRARDPHHFRIAEPVWRRDDDFLAGIAERHDDIEQ